MDLRRVLTGLRHLHGSSEPARVFTDLAAAQEAVDQFFYGFGLVPGWSEIGDDLEFCHGSS